MDVVFITTTAQNLPNVAVKNGQVIALRNCAGYYYDHDNTRWHVGGLLETTSLPPLEDIVADSTTIYLLTALDGSYSPGVYVPNTQHTAWVRIAGNTIDSDAPSDSRYYVRKNQTWSEPYATVHCVNASDDVGRLNAAITSFYSSVGTSGTIKVEGQLRFSTGSSLSVYASQAAQSLTLDFSGASVSVASGHTGPIIDISYRGSSNAAPGKVTILGLDTSTIPGQILDIATSQQVELRRCSFQHGYGAYGNTYTIGINSAVPFKMVDSSVVFVDTTTPTTYPFLLVSFETTPVIITGNTFRFSDPTTTLSERILDLPEAWNGYCVFEDNIIVGSLSVRSDVNNTPVVMNTSLNNTVISEV